MDSHTWPFPLAGLGGAQWREKEGEAINVCWGLENLSQTPCFSRVWFLNVRGDPFWDLATLLGARWACIPLFPSFIVKNGGCSPLPSFVFMYGRPNHMHIGWRKWMSKWGSPPLAFIPKGGRYCSFPKQKGGEHHPPFFLFGERQDCSSFWFKSKGEDEPKVTSLDLGPWHGLAWVNHHGLSLC